MTKFQIILGACLLVSLPAALAAMGVKEEERFERNGREYSILKEKLSDGSVKVHIPRLEGTDQAVVLHDALKGLTVFKDITIGACFLTSLERGVLTSGGPLVHYVNDDTQMTRADYNLVPYGQNIHNLEDVAGSGIAELCQGFPTWHGLVKESNDIAPPSGRRQKRWSWSSSVAVGINKDGKIERCFKTDSGDTAATNCTAGDASSSGTASSNSTNDRAPEEKESGGFLGWIKSLFGRSKRSTESQIRQKRWSFSSSSSVSVGADGVHSCSQSDSGDSSSSKCQSGGAASGGSASSGKNETEGPEKEEEEDGKSFFDWLFGRD